MIHPTGPLFDQESQTLKPQCVRALKRIFILCDKDMDGALSDAELNDFQVPHLILDLFVVLLLSGWDVVGRLYTVSRTRIVLFIT